MKSKRKNTKTVKLTQKEWEDIRIARARREAARPKKVGVLKVSLLERFWYRREPEIASQEALDKLSVDQCYRTAPDLEVGAKCFGYVSGFWRSRSGKVIPPEYIVGVRDLNDEDRMEWEELKDNNKL